MRIVDVRPVPSWKIWKIDQWEVEVELNGIIKEVTIFQSCFHSRPIDEQRFMDYVKNKVLYGTQWPKHLPHKERRIAENLAKLRQLIGREIE